MQLTALLIMPTIKISVSRPALCTHTGFGSEPKNCHSNAYGSFTKHVALLPHGTKIVAFYPV